MDENIQLCLAQVKVLSPIISHIKNLEIRSDLLHTHIAVLFNRKTHLSTARNENVISCRSPVSGIISIHAEMNVISNYLGGDFSKESIENFRRQKLNIFVTRKSKTGLLGTSDPCENCIKKLYYFGINRIYWTDNNRQVRSAKPFELLGTGAITSGNKKKKMRDFPG